MLSGLFAVLTTIVGALACANLVLIGFDVMRERAPEPAESTAVPAGV